MECDSVETARSAGLRYVSDAKPGIKRKRAGKHVRYIAPNGEPVREDRQIDRIRALAIPPAWTDVWICPTPNGHLQATGRDAKGRKQYRYHQRWREVRDETKYDRLPSFAAALPDLRRRVDADLRRPGLDREKVLATVVRLLETTLIRVGNEEYARQNDSYGLTTLHDQHVEVKGSKLHFAFRAKSGKKFALDLRDRRLATIVKRCRDLPGQDLFQYLGPDDTPHTIGSNDVNVYLREVTGEDFTAKDFRTWAGTVHAARELVQCDPATSATEARHTIATAIKAVAERLNNTPAVCRRCYVHPAVVDAYLDGTLHEHAATSCQECELDLRPDEAMIYLLLTQRAEAAQRAA